jgi:hypothetical protein
MSSGEDSDPGNKAKQTGGLLGKAKSNKTVEKAIKSKPKPAKGGRGKGGKGGGTNHGLNTL